MQNFDEEVWTANCKEIVKTGNMAKVSFYYFIITTVHVLNFVGYFFVFLIGKKICGVLIFVAMAAWLVSCGQT